MPELPEVETTRRGLASRLTGRRVRSVRVREPRLRWPVSTRLGRELPGHVIDRVERRAKYLLLRTAAGTVILHLGMSGTLRVVPAGPVTEEPGKHDHVDFVLDHEVLRFRDPRRFGAVLWTRRDPLEHRFLRDLGPEPFSPEFTGAYLYARSRGTRRKLRDFLLDGHVVAGVGNIYANEAAFAAGIHPGRAAGRISGPRYVRLAEAIRRILAAAIDAGGTTVRDFRNSDGESGEFAAQLVVYGRRGEACSRCDGPIRRTAGGGRSLYFCPGCQR